VSRKENWWYTTTNQDKQVQVFRQSTQEYNRPMFTMKGGIKTTEAMKAPVKC
jgi:hypothetical protein